MEIIKREKENATAIKRKKKENCLKSKSRKGVRGEVKEDKGGWESIVLEGGDLTGW